MTPDEAATALAYLLAKRRTGGAVYMGGQHNPLPGEIIEAQRFVRDLTGTGWVPPSREVTE